MWPRITTFELQEQGSEPVPFDIDERYPRIFKGAGAVGLTFSLRIFERLALIPILAYFWGAQTLSNWLVIFASVAHLNLMIAGIPTHAANLMTNSAVRKDWEGVRSFYSNALFLIFIVCSTLIALFFLTRHLVPWRVLIGLDTLSSYEMKWVLLILLTFTALTAIINLPCQAYRAFGLFARGQMIGNVRLFLLFFFVVGAVLSGYGPITIAFLYLVTLSVDLAWLSWDLPRRCPILRLKSHLLKLGTIGKLAKDSMLFSLLLGGSILSLQSNILVTSHILGASAILGYVLIRTLVNVLTTILYEFGRVLWPEISLMNVDKNSLALKRLNISIIRITTALGCVLSAFLFFTGSALITCWSGIDNLLSTKVVMIISISMISRGIYGGSSIFCLALNRHRLLAITQSLGGAAVVVLTAVLTPHYGLIGSAFAFVGSDILFFAIPSLFISARLASVSFSIVIKKILIPQFLIFILLFILCWASYMPSIIGYWNRLCIAAILYFPMAGMLVFYLVLDNAERKIIKTIAKKYF